MGALISFLGGSAFRLIFGEISSYFTKRQEFDREVKMMELQNAAEKVKHDQEMETIRVQAELGVKTIMVKAESDRELADIDAWSKAVDAVGRSTGIIFLDYWNGAIRPLLATLAIMIVVAQVINNGFVLSEWDRELVGAILGIYVADRQLSKRGK